MKYTEKMIKFAQSYDEKTDKNTNKNINWDALSEQYCHHLHEAMTALNNAESFMEELAQVLPPSTHSAIQARCSMLSKIANIISGAQDDILYGIKPAAEGRSEE